MAPDFAKADLFGGAITANIPLGFADVSTIRQVPDHQEVYLSATGFSSITFDIAERVPHLPNDEEALIFHFNDVIAPGDGSKIWQSSAIQLDNIPPVNPTLTLVASTTPANPPSTANSPTSTTILMTLIRLVSKSTDLVITINLPHIPAEDGMNTASATSENSSGDKSRKIIESGDGPSGTLVEDGLKVRDEVLRTLTIHDWNLFGGVEGGS